MAEELIIQHKDKLNLIAEALLEKETLDSTEIAALMEGKSLAELEKEKKLKKIKLKLKTEEKRKKKQARLKLSSGQIKGIYAESHEEV